MFDDIKDVDVNETDNEMDEELENDEVEENEEVEEIEEDFEEGENEQEPAEPAQSPEINAAFAAMRRKMEAMEQQLQAYQQLIQQQQNEQMQKQIELMEKKYLDMGYDPKVIRDIVANSPEIQILKQQNEMLMQQIKQAQEDQRLLSEYNALVAEYPEFVKSPDDIPPEVWKKFEQGYSLVDAYTVVNRKQLINGVQEKAKQKALNNIKSKSHLKTEGDGAGDTEDINIPKETLQTFIDMGMTKKEAQKYYKKFYGGK